MTEVPEPIAVQCMIQQQLLNRTVKVVPSAWQYQGHTKSHWSYIQSSLAYIGQATAPGDQMD